MMRRALALLLAASCGGGDAGGPAQALIVRVHFIAPLDTAPVDGFELVSARAGGFPEFDPLVIAGEAGDYTLTSEDRDTDGQNDAVLKWPDQAAYESEFNVLLEFATGEAFSVDLEAAALDGDVPFARGAATGEVPASGVGEIDLYVECLLDGCATPKANGEACDVDGAPAQCQNGHCVDDFCCESACDGICEQCTGVDGTCEAIALMQDPDGDCGTDPDCKGTCNGSRACEFPPATKTCDDDVCNVCDGKGLCGNRPAGAYPAGECDPCYVCDGSGDCAPATGMDPKGDCDATANCPGVCTGTGGCDYTDVIGDDCGAASCMGTSFAVDKCDDQGMCEPDLTPCDPYVCVDPSGCPTSCLTTNDCIDPAVCDLRTGVCESASVVVCTVGGELQALILACASPPTCYFRISGTCSAITVQDKDVYIDGLGMATIAGSATPALTAIEAALEDTSVVLAAVAINSANGGINASSTSGNPVELQLLDGVLVHLSGMFGVNGNNTALTIEDSTIGSNSADGVVVSGAGSVATLRRSTVENNDGNGITAFSGDVTVEQSLLQDNDSSGIDITGGGLLTLRRSTIKRNRNSMVTDGPAVSVSNSSFTIENSFIVGNGFGVAGVGVSVNETSGSPSMTFRHNTVAGNAGGGISCSGLLGNVSVQWSLFLNAMSEMTGCTSSSSDVPGIEDLCSPTFVDAPGLNYHLVGPSCVDSVASCEIADDFDGVDARTLAAACEVGADELP